jgi:hypothetical protein
MPPCDYIIDDFMVIEDFNGIGSWISLVDVYTDHKEVRNACLG